MIKSYLKWFVVLLLIVLVDQSSKIWVYRNMVFGSDGHIKIWGNLFKLTYVLNYGMAFGFQFGFGYGKLLITLVRIFASFSIAYYIIQALAKSAPSLWIFGWILVLSGAIGNSIDSVFYGIYLDNAPDIAPMKWFHGQVIDMIHFDFWSGVVPSWVPVWGAQEVCVLPIFNIADAVICIGFLFVFCACKQVMIWEQKHKRSGCSIYKL